MSKKYWKGLPELHNSPEFQAQQKNEFAESLPMDEFLSGNDAETSGTSRRDFLKVMGFSTAAVALAACETPVMRSIPYVVKPEEVTPGVANFYATTFYDGHDYASILVKTREGRPIKIEGNDLGGITHSGTNARVQASVLGLYDGARLKGPWVKGAESTWKTADDAAATALNGATIRILTSTIISPSTKAVIAEFTDKHPNTKHVTYDAISHNALTLANKNTFGKAVVSSYDFSKAKIVVGIACDFLGNWIAGEEFSKQYAKNRKVSKANPEMSQHFHFESNLSLTGANADYRFMVKPSELGKVTVSLFNEIAAITGNSKVSGDTKIESAAAVTAIKKAAEKLANNKGKSLVVSGLNDEGVQTLVNGINAMLDNYGKTVDVEKHLNFKQSDDKEFAELVADMASGKVNVLMTYNCNPVYTAPASLKFADAYKKVATRISFSQVMDETSQMATIVCPDHHYLESWGDANPKVGMFTLQQATINPIFAQPRQEGTRQFQDTLLKWSGIKSDYLTYLQGYWNNHVFPNQGKFLDFPSFWAHALHDGAVKVAVYKDAPVAPMEKDSLGRPLMVGVATAMAEVSDSTQTVAAEQPKGKMVVATESIPTPDYNKAASMATSVKGSALELFVYEKVGLGNGTYANNPWLMELPDPISKVTWDNYITMSPIDVKAMGLNEMLRQDIDGSIVDLTVNGITIKVPVYPQPGQAPGSIGLALGYGRNAESLKVANGVGVNAFPFQGMINNTIQPIATNVSVIKTSETHMFAATQIQHTIMGREEFLLREVSLKEFKEKDKDYWNPAVEMAVHGGGKKPVSEVDLWAEHPRPGHKWGMSIDMNLCFGCGACVVACTSENNVAVVGKLEVSRVREMHWLRIDRYYSSDVTKHSAQAEGLMETKKMYIDMENPSANPQVTFQPMMCQHCNHAPCETVCPVLATSHSTEGLNMMTYNRCIGTRYCANNCPFKVRRFNWFNYNGNDLFADVNPAQQELGRMVLNPDVVVRSRGVMEKCSMCQQKLQAGKLEAKKAGMPVKDGAIKTACQSACSTDAIIFGDLNDSESQVTKERNDERTYFLLEDVGIKPTTSYKVKVRNQDEQIIFHDDVVGHSVKKEEAHHEEKHS
ncbi:TAT-variant-translocated molybdopterin oxidoreductase [Aurantibacillus circumpalustris]|uniref:TAT-variant-translocated molybdopterin oxidoreductase n=1 Tax=Aurantibacillus circumpalustris TaxID=3036359 RepID=UPI00295BAE78|nr:TAT-variant-translocated molybdopterin oxidoreductase [Aurantibacillus circumpalustris]